MPLIGTAGHVDHGKSTLVKRITGRDPDRWEEEKKRGLTIDLGFSWSTLPRGTEVSFVDVPGHERYLKNMLAGIEAIDVALFVVAADEGWKPQSEEHLAVLDLLDVDRAVVALTKTDTVDTDLVELASAEIEERLEGTSLEGSPIVAVSAITGAGVDSLLETLEMLVGEPTDPGERPRLWVDRSFSVPGAGTVVTGSLLGGPLSVADAVEIYPQRTKGRVRGLQSHERSHDVVAPGRRVAVNVGGIDHDAVRRGDMVGLQGQWETSARFSASVRPARFVDGIDPHGAYTLHMGSSALRVDIVDIEEHFAVLRVDRALPMAVGDRLILRDTGRHLVVGGGRVLDPGPGRTKRALRQAKAIDPTEPPNEIATRLLGWRRTDLVSRLRAHTAGGIPDAVIVGETAVDAGLAAELSERAHHLVGEAHELHPLRPGLPMATLADKLRVEGDLAERIVELTPDLERRGPDVALAGHGVSLTNRQTEAWERAKGLLSADLAVPDETDLDLDPELLHLKIRAGELVRVSPGLVYLPEQLEALRGLLATLGKEFTVAQFRDTAGLSRKYAVPILEWFDKEGLTVRSGDLRRLR